MINLQGKERIYGLDALRASLMLLGVILHSTLAYGTLDLGDGWRIKDPVSQSKAFDVLIDFLHLFRMPVFFVVSGFFAAYLYFQRGAHAMLINRMRRIGAPFVVFWIVLFPVVVFSVIYSLANIAGSVNAASDAFSLLFTGAIWSNANTMHLWFLYYLTIFTLIFWLGSLLNRSYLKIELPRLKGFFRRAFTRVWHPLLFVPVTFFTLIWIGAPSFEGSTSMFPSAPSLIGYLYFYGFGWLLYRNADQIFVLTASYRTYVLIILPLYIVRLAIFVAMEGNKSQLLVLAQISIAALIIWLWVFSLIGVFIRVFKSHSAPVSYLSDASYWVYLVHIPFVMIGQGVLAHENLTAGVKFTIVTITALSFCFLTYHLFVRHGLVGNFLNGRRLHDVHGEKTSTHAAN